MRSLLSRGLWLIVLLVPALVGLLHGGQEQNAPDDPIPRLIKQLGSDVYAKRQDAHKKLITLGEKAVPALRKAAAASADIEIRRRAHELVLAIMPPTRKSKSIGLDLVLLEPGEFQMGAPIFERGRQADEVQHRVRIKEPFYLGKHEVTQGEYKKIMDTNPSWFAPTGGGKDKVGAQDTSQYPIENVTWYDAIEFCNRLSKRDGLPPFYQIAEVKRDGKTVRMIVTLLGGNGYRLPTEAEWEFACRAYVDGPFHFAKAPTGREANFRSSSVGGYGGGPLWNALNHTEKVGSYAANPRGLFDMHGNVGEWCWDYYNKDYYANSPGVDPLGPNTGTHRVTRGGSWLVTEGSCRSASRAMLAPGERSYAVGFRVARNP